MASNPLIQKLITLELQADGEVNETSFSADVVECEVVATPGTVQSVTTLDGETHSDVGPTSYALRLVLVQDWDDVRPGLARYLWDHKGDECVFAYNAHGTTWGGTTPGYTGTIAAIIPPAYGGAGNEFVTVELTMPLTGTPSLVETDPNP